MDKDTVMEQLMQLKAMTVRTGGIHDAQKLQLMRWPELSKNVKINATKVKVDPENKAVYMECVGNTKVYKTDKFDEKLFKNILSWVRTILWDETRVVIKINKKRVFDSATH